MILDVALRAAFRITAQYVPQPRDEAEDRIAGQLLLQGIGVAEKELQKSRHVGAVPHAVEKGLGGAKVAAGKEAPGEAEIANDHHGVTTGFGALEAQAASVRQDDRQRAAPDAQQQAEGKADQPGNTIQRREIFGRDVDRSRMRCRIHELVVSAAIGGNWHVLHRCETSSSIRPSKRV